MNPRDYIVQVSPLPSRDGGGFVAFVPDLPGCMSDGATPEEALGNAYAAAESWLEAAMELGRAIPPPSLAARSA